MRLLQVAVAKATLSMLSLFFLRHYLFLKNKLSTGLYEQQREMERFWVFLLFFLFIFKGAWCCLGEEIQTQNFNILNNNEAKLQTHADTT